MILDMILVGPEAYFLPKGLRPLSFIPFPPPTMAALPSIRKHAETLVYPLPRLSFQGSLIIVLTP